MASIPIHNETDYALTDAMTQHILRDAQEHFGEGVHAIRVQSGIERHAFNARTHEVRYAFSPQDFGLMHTLPIAPEPPRSRRRPPRRAEETEAAILPAAECCARTVFTSFHETERACFVIGGPYGHDPLHRFSSSTNFANDITHRRVCMALPVLKRHDLPQPQGIV